MLAAALLVSCGSEDAEVEIRAADDPGVQVEVSPPPDVAPLHDGTVVMAGPYPVEVVAHDDGEVEAYLLGGDAPAGADVTLTIDVPVEQRASGRPVRMTWDPAGARFVGRVRRVDIVEGPLDLELEVEGVEYRGHVDVIVIVVTPAPARRPAADVTVVVEDEGRPRRKHKHKHRNRRRKRRDRGDVVIEIR